MRYGGLVPAVAIGRLVVPVAAFISSFGSHGIGSVGMVGKRGIPQAPLKSRRSAR